MPTWATAAVFIFGIVGWTLAVCYWGRAAVMATYAEWCEREAESLRQFIKTAAIRDHRYEEGSGI